MWVFFAFLSAFTLATHLAVAKKLAKDLSPYLLGSGYFFVSFPLLVIYIIMNGIPPLSQGFVFAVLMTVLINIVAHILLLKGLVRVDMSIASPILAITPIFALLPSYFFLKEVPSLLGGLGIFIAVGGLAALNYKSGDGGNNDAKNTGSQKLGLAFIFLVTFLYGLSANFDKLASIKSSPLFGTLVVMSLIGLGMLMIVVLKKEYPIFARENNFLKILFLGLIVVLSVVVWYIALSKGTVAYGLTIRRFSAIIGIFYGYFWFKEKHIVQRLLGAAVVLAGLVLVIFFG